MISHNCKVEKTRWYYIGLALIWLGFKKRALKICSGKPVKRLMQNGMVLKEIKYDW